MKTKKIKNLPLAVKAVASWDYEIGVLEEVRKQLVRLANIERANMRTVNKFHAMNNCNYSDYNIKRMNESTASERDILFQLMQGLSYVMSNTDGRPGIIPHGKQLSLFEPLYVETGE